MFLCELNKNEAVAFIGLVEELAKIDKEFEKNEKQLIEDYLDELSISKEEFVAMEVDESLNVLENSTERCKKIIYFELVGLALVDGTFDGVEEELLGKIANKFGITKCEERDFLNYFKIVQDSYEATVVEYECKVKTLRRVAEELLGK